MLAGLMAVIQQNNETVRKDLADNQESVKKDLAAVQESVRKDLAENQESVRKDLAENQESVKKELAAVKESVRADLAASQENVKSELSKIRKDLKFETESVIKRFETQNQATRKELKDKLESETKRLTNLISQNQQETESELLGAKRQIQSMSSEFEARTIQVSEATHILIEECRTEVNEQIGQQKEQLKVVNERIMALETQVAETPRPAVGVESSTAPHNLVSPSVVIGSDQNNMSVSPDENRICSCQTISCNTCNVQNVNECRMQAPENQVSSYLSPTELPLPIFEEVSDTNPVYHLRQLDEFMKFRGIPKALQLAVAYRSVKGQMGRQWVETASNNLKDYEEFKKAFLNTFWSSLRQGVEKCTLYQGRYDRGAGVSLSAYFLRQATTASYLEPKLNPVEIIQLLRTHYPVHIQRVMLSNQLSTIEQALDLLKQIEMMEVKSESSQRPHNVVPNQINNSPRHYPNNSRGGRVENRREVRQVQYDHRNRRRNGNDNRNWRREDRNREERSTPLNPNAPSFSGNQQNRQEENHGQVSS
jgi:hypothetical protein